MFIVEITYTAPLEEIDHFLQAHRDFLDYYYKQNLLLASGPMHPRTGGIIIALTKDRAYLESIFAQDPFQLVNLASYRFIAFSPVKHRDEIKDLIQKTEGKLC